MTTAISAPGKRWLVPTGLIVLSIVPMIGGAIRVADLTGGQVTPENARFFAMPLPVLLHIFTATPFLLLGALQFTRRRGRRHRIAGRIAVPCGLVAGLTGLWMTLSYPSPESVLLEGFRLVFGSAMVVLLGLGFVAIRRRDFRQHRAWMIRGYALGMGAGTQVLTSALWSPIDSSPGPVTKALLLGAGWVINLAVAEWAIRRHSATRVRESR